MEEATIVGAGCRFPGATNLLQFRELLSAGRSAISKGLETRWSSLMDQVNVSQEIRESIQWGGVLESVQHFDYQFFGIPKDEADQLDPQQRLLLEVSWHALESSCMNPHLLRNSKTGVYLGATNADYHRMVYQELDQLGPYSASGTALGTASNRLSYFYGFKGPSITVDTGCSSSLVALDLAIEDLLNGSTDMAVVAGVNLMLHPYNSIAHALSGAISKSGKSVPYENSADGYVRSEGCGVLILKRRNDAINQGLQCWANISDIGVNHDGRSNGFTAPNGQAQRELLREIYQENGVKDIRHIETHTVGSPMGDAIELKALSDVIKSFSQELRKIDISSVKSNIGHLESASGIASIIKTLLSIRYSELYPTVGYKESNRFFNFDKSSLSVLRDYKKIDVEPGDKFCVSAFSFGGTNAHVVCEVPTKSNERLNGDAEVNYPLILSAQSEAQLREFANELSKRHRRDTSIQETANQLASRAFHDFRIGLNLNGNVDAIDWLRRVYTSEEQPTKSTRTKVHIRIYGDALRGMDTTGFVEQSTNDNGIVFTSMGETLFRCDCDTSLDAIDLIQKVAIVRWIKGLGVQVENVSGEGKGVLAAAVVNEKLSLGSAIQYIDRQPLIDKLMSNSNRQLDSDATSLIKIGTAGNIKISDRTASNSSSLILALLSHIKYIKPGFSRCSQSTIDEIPNYPFSKYSCWL